MKSKGKASISQSGKLGRLVASVPEELLLDVEQAVMDYRRSEGKRISTSAIVEVALRELLSKADVTALLCRYDPSGKRTVIEE